LQRAALVSLGKGLERNAVSGQSSAYLTSPTLSDPYVAAIVIGPQSRSNNQPKWNRNMRVSLICFANILFTLFNNQLGCQAEPPAAEGGETY
jgi:hypothetical protein